MLRMIALLIFGMQTANAVMITLDPTDYGVGTNLSHVQDGLTISRLSWPNGSPFGAPLPPTRSDVFAISCIDHYYSCLTPEGLGFGGTYMVLDYEACVRGSSICGYTQALEFVFSDLTSDVSLTFTWGSDQPTMMAYDINGNLIDTCNGYGNYCGTMFPADRPSSWGTILSINREQRDIYRIIAGGLAGASFAHSITYSVPEPGTVGLLALGLAGFLVRRGTRRSL